MTRMAAGYIDDKIVMARQLLREGKSLKAMAPYLGYRSGEGVRAYLKSMGLPTASIKGTRYRPTYSDEERQVRSQSMKRWYASYRLQKEGS